MAQPGSHPRVSTSRQAGRRQSDSGYGFDEFNLFSRDLERVVVPGVSDIMAGGNPAETVSPASFQVT